MKRLAVEIYRFRARKLSGNQIQQESAREFAAFLVHVYERWLRGANFGQKNTLFVRKLTRLAAISDLNYAPVLKTYDSLSASSACVIVRGVHNTRHESALSQSLIGFSNRLSSTGFR
ncbi:MAG TPA: hypothetical protein VK493_17835, partial [Bryobacteraceae bacterium]|nr:hypothetical protein [Bryobacteraceae bacterium]